MVSHAFFVEALFGEVFTVGIVGTDFCGAVAERVLDEVVDGLIGGAPCAAAGGAAVLGIGGVASDHETNTGGVA